MPVVCLFVYFVVSLCLFVWYINRVFLFGSESDTQYVVVVVLTKMALTLSQERFVYDPLLLVPVRAN